MTFDDDAMPYLMRNVGEIPINGRNVKREMIDFLTCKGRRARCEMGHSSRTERGREREKLV